MKTQLLKVNEDSIALGAKLIREGELVGFPTETVYGLGGGAAGNSHAQHQSGVYPAL